MLKSILKHTFIWILIVGIFNVAAIMIAEGLSGADATEIVGNGTFVTKQTIEGTNLVWYKFDIINYLKNIEQALKFNNLNILPANWPTTPPYSDNVWNNVANGMLYALKVIITFIELLILTPLKILFYPLFIIMALLGTDLGEIQNIINGIYTITIPAINYI